MRFAVDTGGTFTDLVIEDTAAGTFEFHKSATVPSDPVQGILDVFEVAANDRRVRREELLASGSVLIHGTTRGLNAVLTGRTARTALLTTLGHPDVLTLREGGRTNVFDFRDSYPQPYVPRRLTFEIPERITSAGEILRPLDERAVLDLIPRLEDADVEAIAVCLLWSIVNPVHELRVGALLRERLSDVALTLSHEVNPCLREYRRASSTAIDASLKPVISSYVSALQERLGTAGFRGRLLIVTSSGGALDAADVASAPVLSLNSGPAMAPVAGRYFASVDTGADTAIVADTGGTSYDVSLVRRGRIPWTREAWIGAPYAGHMTGFPSVDVRSVGSGGGSIAYVDDGGLLHVGPESAGADPGPVCYGRGGERPTTTDACLVLGILDPGYFLGGRAALDREAAAAAIDHEVGQHLGLGTLDSAAEILRLATERMVSAIEEITIHQGIDPSTAILVGGGGAAGFNCVAIARRLGCATVIVPLLGPALSAAGALISDLSRSFEVPFGTSTTAFDFEAVNDVLGRLEQEAEAFIAGPGSGTEEAWIEFSVEAHYPQQAWELEVPLRQSRLGDEDALAALLGDFHAVHRDVFAVADETSEVEFTSWHARARCRLAEPATPHVVHAAGRPDQRVIYLPDVGPITAEVWKLDALPPQTRQVGPAIVETAATTVVVDPDASFSVLDSGTLCVTLPTSNASDGPQSSEVLTGAR